MRRPRRLTSGASDRGRINGEMQAIKEAIENVDPRNRDAVKRAMTSVKIEPGPNLSIPYGNIKFIR